MDEKFLKPYDPEGTEGRIYAEWEKSGFFNPDECIKQGITKPDAKPFSIVLPPPNVTGVLHVGHTYEDSLQDAVVRYHRMRGEPTVWIPGTDSAAIATQS
ncbi:MAG: class I tRNA ligase family protein, partial [Candidatus Kaiserbacteria bacterium]|nr:class I tRNA ligase family protein [Candidatus Kaiserbacteria bacterium]